MSTTMARRVPRASVGAELKMVRFGSVTVMVCPPSEAEVRRNIRAGQLALSRARARFVTHGVKLSYSRNVPLFSADPDDPTVLIRQLHGKKERGVLGKDGRFEAFR